MGRITIVTIFRILLLSLGVYQIIAALLAVFFWLVAGDWRDFIPQIAVIAFWLNFPVSLWAYQRWSQSHPRHR